MKENGKDESELASSRAEVESNFIERMEICSAKVGSVSALAREAGISQSGIRRYFSGGEPTRPHLLSIAQAAGVNVQWLATGEGRQEAVSYPPRQEGEALRVRENMPESPPEPPVSGLDLALLERVITELEESLQHYGFKLRPHEKAETIAMAYDLALLPVTREANLKHLRRMFDRMGEKSREYYDSQARD
ncbi:helix-turn-helix transcriptional regulator [Salinicola sp. JS01]|uniref:helix-turn-helix domain-containing protein n=1 Tax=Salinicola sp. JS01 TaxID=3050071 RepID=UPI00255BF4EF|nr:helix-turn-helix transcriptional regulator [Salinicola sp. JS01]WIX31211.1 helix-turn-helix transcriptional regulator [Salinicola sp. JS01]